MSRSFFCRYCSVLIGMLLMLPAHSQELEPQANDPATGAVAPQWIVRGRVLEKGSRKPLANISVVVNEQDQWYATTDDSGHFSIDIDKAGDYTLSIIGIGYIKPNPIGFRVDTYNPIETLRLYLEPAFLLPDVVVYADRNPDKVGKLSISGKELEQIAGGAGDPLRAMQALPGVVVTNDSSANPAIRGSAPGDNIYYVDFLPVGYLFHFGGFSSVINADLVQDFNLHAAAYGAEYGDALGAVIDVKLREPRSDRFGGKVNVNLYQSDFVLEGPVGNNQSFFFSARRSYFDLLLPEEGDLDEDEGIEYTQFPTFHDYQGKYQWGLGQGDKISLQISGAADRAEIYVPDDADAAERDPDLAGDSSLDTSYDSQGIVWTKKLNRGTSNRLALGHLALDLRQELGSVGFADVLFNDYYMREHFNFTLFDNHSIGLGGEYRYSVIDFELDFKDPQCGPFEPGCDFTSAERKQNEDTLRINNSSAFIKDRWRLAKPVTLIVGARVSYDDYLQETFAEPRLGAEWQATARTLLTAGWGRYHQFPGATEVIDEFGNPELSNRLAQHSVMGIEQSLAKGWSWKTEAYYKTFEDLVVPDSIFRYLNAGNGRAYGLDVLVKKDLSGRLSGWLALTHSRSELTNTLTDETFPADYDQPAIAKLVANYKLSSKWSFGAKWHYHSGSPYTPVVAAVLRDPLDTTSGYLPIYGEINSKRLPAYHRLDLRVDRDFLFDAWKLNTYFELINAYNNKNLAGYSYNTDYTDRDPVYQLPLLLSFGVQAEF